ncbi:hypothetical protein ACHAWT_009219 [Skeletonema menzelii]
MSFADVAAALTIMLAMPTGVSLSIPIKGYIYHFQRNKRLWWRNLLSMPSGRRTHLGDSWQETRQLACGAT